MNKIIITTSQFQPFFSSDDSSSHSLQNCIFQSTIHICIYIDDVNLQRGVETYGPPFSIRFDSTIRPAFGFCYLSHSVHHYLFFLSSLMHEWSLTQVKEINVTSIFKKERERNERTTIYISEHCNMWVRKPLFLYLDTFLITYYEKSYRLLSKQKIISLRHTDACAYSSFFFSDVNNQYPWRKKAYKYTDICITSKIHIIRQSTIKLAINKCRLPIRICKDRNSRIVKILVCIWRERLIQCNRANHFFVLYFLAPNFGSESWITNPFGLAPPINGTPVINDVGNGQQSSYQEQTYTLPGGSMSYYESSG